MNEFEKKACRLLGYLDFHIEKYEREGKDTIDVGDLIEYLEKIGLREEIEKIKDKE